MAMQPVMAKYTGNRVTAAYYIKTVRARVYIFMESAFIGYYYRSVGEEFVYLIFVSVFFQ